MKNRKFKKILLSSTITLIPLVTTISCSNFSGSDNFAKSWVGNRKHLVSHINLPEGNDTLKWFGTVPYSSARSYSGFKDAEARLVSQWTDEKLDSKANQSKKRLKLKQAKAIEVTYVNEENEEIKHIFDEDKPLTNDQKLLNPKNINSNKFQELLANSKIKKFDFILRDDNYWVNHKGEKTKYKVTNKDFLRGLRINLLHWISEYRYEVAGWTKSISIKETSPFEKRFTDKVRKGHFDYSDVDNTYIFDIAGLPWQNFFGLSEDGKLVNEEQIAPSNEPKKVSFHFEGETQPTIWWEFLLNDHNTAFSAVPSSYIDQLSNDYYSLPKSNNLGKLGFYKYGRKFDEMLYAGAYYVSKNTRTVVEVRKNLHYAVPDIRNNKNAILKYSTFISKSASDDSTPLQAYNRFKNGVQYFVNQSYINNLPSSNRIEIFKKYSDTIVRSQYFSVKDSSHTLNWAMLPNITKSNRYLYQNNYNENFRKILFGKTSNELKEIDLVGTNEVYKHMFTKSAVFKSLIHGSINWEQFAVINSKGKRQYWPLFAAPGGVVKLKKGVKKNILDLYTKKGYTNLPMLKWDPNIKKPVSMGELNGKLNFDRVSKISNAIEVWKSHRYDEVEKELKVLLDSIFGSGSKEVEISFALPVRTSLLQEHDQISYKNIANTLEGLNLGRYKIKIIDEPNKSRDKMIPNWSKWVYPNIVGKGMHDYIGWGADYSGVLGLTLAGKINSSSRRAQSGVQYLSYLSSLDENSNIVKTYPHVKLVADYYKKKYNELINSNEFQDKIKKNIESNKANNKSFYTWSELQPKITTPFENLVTKQNLSKTVSSVSNTFLDIVLGSTKNLRESKINKIISDIARVKFQAWVISVQQIVLENDESKIKAFMDEFSLLNGINIQIATTRNNLIIGKNSSSVSIWKKWLKATQARGGYVHLAEWSVEGD